MASTNSLEGKVIRKLTGPSGTSGLDVLAVSDSAASIESLHMGKELKKENKNDS
jgi:hypothetical protein